MIYTICAFHGGQIIDLLYETRAAIDVRYLLGLFVSARRGSLAHSGFAIRLFGVSIRFMPVHKSDV